jgi:hypothetical protein
MFAGVLFPLRVSPLLAEPVKVGVAQVGEVESIILEVVSPACINRIIDGGLS